MSISTKGKRKLICQGKTYYWHVSADYDRADLRKNFNVLHIIAEDKSLELYLPFEKMDPVVESVTPQMVEGIIKRELEK